MEPVPVGVVPAPLALRRPDGSAGEQSDDQSDDGGFVVVSSASPVEVGPGAQGGAAVLRRLLRAQRPGDDANADLTPPPGPAPAPVRLALTADLPAPVPQPAPPGAYHLRVTAGGVDLRAVDEAGLRHGLVTLRQLAGHGTGHRYGHGDGDTWVVRPVEVLDAPRFGWRGLSLDVARHFLPVAGVVAVLDALEDLKLDVLHLHLTDDQGWRLEVPSRPALVERSGPTAVDGDPGGWYSVEEWRGLVAQAAERGVRLVPEIDLPGHVNAALHALGELTPSGEPATAYTGIGVGFSRLHADLPATGAFLRDVLTDVAALTEGPHVHLGGDEVLTMDASEYELLVRTAADVLRAAGRTPVAWQEAASAGLGPDAVLQVWDLRQDMGPVRAAAASGAGVVLSPASRVYLDMKYDAATRLGLEWAGHVPLAQAYDWEPLAVVPGLDPARVLGVEAALWSETTRSLDDVTELLLPRLAAVAEVAWSAPDRRDPDDFLRRVVGLAPGWDRAGLRWHRAAGAQWDGSQE
ncbi:family 20 glycosylhydrolase [Cellulomonas marina]|uniref:beta-N-acetylhexosaminidase n=1 Tax=Cellulomonas marina TaxID=988821 RepID=A0A1I0Z2X7_9CELL|nr:family 20 glycosylhydrolase [Cellulomonas marina]GIG28195.1 hypothetical protein Cma02nite_07950 [Cellulomonas marina]SFB19732.1 hexosaminidase [Cellulomonas marina]